MRLVTFQAHEAAAARLGAVVGETVVDLAALGAVAGIDLPADMLAFIDLDRKSVV